MTKYIVSYYSIPYKRWGVYHSTFDMSDAYSVHAQLKVDGYEASIRTEYVDEAA